jgi:hypothetical protein
MSLRPKRPRRSARCADPSGRGLSPYVAGRLARGLSCAPTHDLLFALRFGKALTVPRGGPLATGAPATFLDRDRLNPSFLQASKGAPISAT